MPKILSHTPAWLSRPSTGFKLFQPGDKPRTPQALNNGAGKKMDYTGPQRTVVHRGTEIFFVVGNELRWSDLVLLKEGEEEEDVTTEGGDLEKYCKILKTPVAGQIRQLVISPLGDLLAIVTSHTVHVAILPMRFDAPNTGPIRLKTFQLGPTAHVLEQAPIASVLWHPLGCLGSCLVTVTADACVRLWELERNSRHSFDEPALAIDLKKLANASSAGEDFRASVYGISKGFSPDSVEMEVAAACFGGIGSSDEHGWAPMTLWLAMTEGDVYALCPLLPRKWQPAHSTIPSLSTAVMSKAAHTVDDDLSERERKTLVQQQKWLSDIDDQEPDVRNLPEGFETVEVYDRPAHPPAIPKLQGPFHLSPEPDFDEITDIFAIAPRVDDVLLVEDDEEDFDGLSNRSGLSVGVICLLTQSGNTHICLDLEGVEAKWLPLKRGGFQRPSDMEDDNLDLLLLETISQVQSGNAARSAMFSPNVPNRYAADERLYSQDHDGRYAFYVTLGSGVYSFSLVPWISNLEEELSGSSDTGASFRVGILYESEKTLVHEIMDFGSEGTKEAPSPSACISLIDSDLGHFILAPCNDLPHAVVLDLPLDENLIDSFAPDDKPLALPAPELREPYQPPPAFYAQSGLSAFLDSLTQSGSSRLRKGDLKSQVRLSPATLQLLTDAHRVLADETNRLGLAASDLFRRCQRMKAELSEQVRKVDEVYNRVDAVTGDDDEESEISGSTKIDYRMTAAREKGQELQQRVDALRRKMAGLDGKELSRREEAWATEVKAMSEGLEDSGNGTKDHGDASPSAGSLQSRFDAVSKLRQDLVARAKEAAPIKDEAEADEEQSLRESSRVPLDFRKQKLQQVMRLLERETALVDAVTERLSKLSGLS